LSRHLVARMQPELRYINSLAEIGVRGAKGRAEVS
jgi:hypothetical protein